jgi:hypothetical protein
MFKSLDEMIRIRFAVSRLQLLRDTLVRGAVGVAGAVAGFQAVYSMILALE